MTILLIVLCGVLCTVYLFAQAIKITDWKNACLHVLILYAILAGIAGAFYLIGA